MLIIITITFQFLHLSATGVDATGNVIKSNIVKSNQNVLGLVEELKSREISGLIDIKGFQRGVASSEAKANQVLN